MGSSPSSPTIAVSSDIVLQEVDISFVHVSGDEAVTTLTLSRGKVNALNEPLVEELTQCLQELENDRQVRSIILTGSGKFFSFGFDIPEFLDYSPESFAVFLRKFTSLYTYIFLFPKPVVAALNGHTIAGGCMLAAACDYRLMVAGKAKISLNEVEFGSSVFAGSVEILKYCVGERNAELMLGSGAMYPAEEAHRLGLVDQVASEDNLMNEARSMARDLAEKDSVAFGSIKGLLRRPVAEHIAAREEQSIREFIDIWHSESNRGQLKEIKIHS